jgi:preprotein translocase subunit SecG
MSVVVVIIIIVVVVVVVVIIIIRHELGPNSPASASSNSLFYGLPSRLWPFGLQFSIIFHILFLLILATCRSRFDLYLPSFSSTGSTFNSFQNFFTLFVVKNCVPGRAQKIGDFSSTLRSTGKIHAKWLQCTGFCSRQLLYNLIQALRSIFCAHSMTM